MTAGARRPRWPGADLPGRRLFVAVPLPAEASAAIEHIVESVRAEGVPGGGRDVRWVRLDGLHLTLRFLGPTLEDRVAARDRRAPRGRGRGRSVRRRRSAAPGPSRRPDGRERCGSASGPAPSELVELARVVDAELTAAGWTFEPRPLSPHLTLARSDGVPAGAAIGQRLVAMAADLDIRFRADRIGLFESLTGGGPARYEPLELARLAGSEPVGPAS